jgi:hypothetical protein
VLGHQSVVLDSMLVRVDLVLRNEAQLVLELVLAAVHLGIAFPFMHSKVLFEFHRGVWSCNG